MQGKLGFIAWLRFAGFGELLFEAFDAGGNKLQINEQQLRKDFGEVLCGFDAVSIRGDGGFIEGADDGDEQVKSADFFEVVFCGESAMVAGEIQAGKVETIDSGVDYLFGFVKLGEKIEPGVGDGDDGLFD